MAFAGDFANGLVPRSFVSPFGLEFEHILEDHGVSSQAVDEMLASEVDTTSAAFQRNRLSQHYRGTGDASALSFCGILPLRLTCRLVLRSSPSNLWI